MQQSVAHLPAHSAQRTIKNLTQSDEYKFCEFSGGLKTNSQHSDDVPPGFTKNKRQKEQRSLQREKTPKSSS